MRLSVEKQEFAKLLSHVARVATSKSFGSSNRSIIKLKTQDQSLLVSASDLDMTIEGTIPISLEETGTAVVPARLLVDIVRAFPDEKINLSALGESLRLVGKHVNYELQTYPSELFPARIWPNEKGVKIEAELLRTTISQVIRAASDDEIRPVLTGVFIEERSEGLRLVATDSYRLSLKDITSVNVFQVGTKALVPARALSEADRILASFEDSSEIWINLAEDFARFEAGNIVLWTQLINETFPDYEALIPSDSELSIEIEKENLLSALKRMRILVKDAVSSVKIQPTADGLELSIVSPDIGRAQEILEATVKGEEFPVAFNPSYLIDGIEAVNDDIVVLEVIKSKKPTLIYAKGDSTFKYLLMPVRLNETQRT